MYRTIVVCLIDGSAYAWWSQFASEGLLMARYFHDAAPFPIDDMGLVIEGPEFIPVIH